MARGVERDPRAIADAARAHREALARDGRAELLVRGTHQFVELLGRMHRRERQRLHAEDARERIDGTRIARVDEDAVARARDRRRDAGRAQCVAHVAQQARLEAVARRLRLGGDLAREAQQHDGAIGGLARGASYRYIARRAALGRDTDRGAAPRSRRHDPRQPRRVSKRRGAKSQASSRRGSATSMPARCRRSCARAATGSGPTTSAIAGVASTCRARAAPCSRTRSRASVALRPRSRRKRPSCYCAAARRRDSRPSTARSKRWRGVRERAPALGLVTNGAAAPQRAKIDRFDLARFFDVIVVEGEAGFGKPDRRVFERALGALGVDAAARADGGRQLRVRRAGRARRRTPRGVDRSRTGSRRRRSYRRGRTARSRRSSSWSKELGVRDG